MTLGALWPTLACSELIAFQPLHLFYADEPRALGIGLPIPLDAPVNFSDPMTLMGRQSTIDLEYQFENIVRDQDAKLVSQQLEVEGIYQADIPFAGSTSAGLRLGNFDSDYRFSDHDDYEITQQADEQTISLAAELNPFVAIGAGIERIRADTRALYSVEARIPGWLRVKYRDYHESAAMTVRVAIEEHAGSFEIAPDNHVHELALATGLSGVLDITLTADLEREHNGAAEISLAPSETLRFSYQYAERRHEFSDVIEIDDTPEGTTAGEVNAEQHVILLRYTHSDRTELFSSAQWSRYRFSAGGRVRGEPLLFFWDDLVIGERRFAADYTLNVLQYALGTEYRHTPAVTLRGGLQYLRVETDGDFNHWTPIPLLGIGKLDEETIQLPYEGATFGGISFGIGYRFGAMDLSYAISQLLLFERREVTKGPTGAGATESTTGLDSSSAMSNFWNGIRDNPGGNLHVLRLSWNL